MRRPNTVAECTRCNRVFDVRSMIPCVSAKRGGNAKYICAECDRTNERYHTSNDTIVGKNYKHEIRIGVEVETSYTDSDARNAFFEYGCIATHDGSLRSDGTVRRYGWDENTCEYVTPIMNGLPTASKLALTVQRMADGGHLKMNSSCGTHFHVSINNMEDANGDAVYMSYIRRFYNSLFMPLTVHLANHPEDTEKVFGRYFGQYRHKITWTATQEEHDDRYYYINCMADNNIEFRLNKFVNAKQYQALMKMCIEMTECIVKNFCEHFNDENINVKLYNRIDRNGNKVASKTKYRKHKAEVTADKLVKIFQKYANR